MEDENFNIKFAVGKSNLQEYYKCPVMPMRLRMVAGNVYGGRYGMGQRPMLRDYVCLMLRRLILALVKEGQNKRSLFQARDVQAELIGAVEVQWFLH